MITSESWSGTLIWDFDEQLEVTCRKTDKRKTKLKHILYWSCLLIILCTSCHWTNVEKDFQLLGSQFHSNSWLVLSPTCHWHSPAGSDLGTAGPTDRCCAPRTPRPPASSGTQVYWSAGHVAQWRRCSSDTPAPWPKRMNQQTNGQRLFLFTM